MSRSQRGGDGFESFAMVRIRDGNHVIENEVRIVAVGTANLYRPALVTRETIGVCRLRYGIPCVEDFLACRCRAFTTHMLSTDVSALSKMSLPPARQSLVSGILTSWPLTIGF